MGRMIRIRRSQDRGRAEHGWLSSRHTFSFADYHDPAHMGFRDLRVINEDRVQPGQGFGTHAHRDMEILTWVLEGALEHRDSLGNGSVIRPGDAQRMSAGTGVTHSEYNPSADALVHFLQIWILPARRGIPPSYEQQHFPEAERRNVLRRVASPDARDGSVRLHQDAAVHAALLDPGKSVRHGLGPGRHAWLQVARGAVDLGAERLAAGDGAAISEETAVAITAREPSEVVLFDLR
jgi:redox-sensitive bicupin YhaK (pirin superfamily)